MMEYVLLNNNVKMPKLGYGVFQVSNEECERCVLDAISVGYRAIDTAQSYGNEEAVGNAIQKCGVPREELFLTSKIWMSNASYEKAKASIDYIGLDQKPQGSLCSRFSVLFEIGRASCRERVYLCV